MSKEEFRFAPDYLWAAAAGVVVSLGIAALYRGLSTANASLVAPTAAVVGAIVPLWFGIFLEGLPSFNQSLGMALSLVGIGLVSSGSGNRRIWVQPGLVMGIMAGIGFGLFFLCVAQIAQYPFFLPLAIAKCTSFMVAAFMLLFQRSKPALQRESLLPVLAGVLDAAGNVFFLLARQNTRIDLAVILSSMYPASTVILSWLILKEKINRMQITGIIVCLLALVLLLV